MVKFFTSLALWVAAFSAFAAASYPVQEFRMGIFNTNRNVAVEDGAVTSQKITGGDEEKWTLNYISSGVYEIVSSSSSRIITNQNGTATLAGDADGANQRWNIVPVQNDFDGYPLYYKITSNANSSLALTFNPASNSFSLDSYSGANYQKFKLNLDGLEGYAANAMTPAGEKAGTIGGLLGQVVYVSTDKELINALNSEDPMTVVVTADIDMRSHSHTRIRDFKTLVGSFSKHTLYDPYFRTNNEYGKDEPSDNIVIKNLKMIAKNEPNRILVNVWSSRQIWIDHIYFESQLSYDRTGNGQDEVGKFIWINTPYESYYDAKDRTRSPDYVTISYCHLKNRYWTVAYGTQNDEITRDRTTLLYNWWDKNVRRCPQLGNGSAHVYNNYFSAYGTGSNGSATSGIIGGDGSDIISINNRFNGYSVQQALMMGGGNEPARDDNSYLSTALDGTPSKVSFSPKKTSSWKPETSNYGYSLLAAYNTKGTDTKDFCSKYSGVQSSEAGWKYITDSEFDSWVQVRYPAPFLVDIEVGSLKEADVLDTLLNYTIKNVNSGLFLNTASAAAGGVDVVQSAESVVWTLSSVGDGYYSLHPDRNASLNLDLDGGSADNGTNIHIWGVGSNTNQHFKFVDNGDGTYTIVTRDSKDRSCLGIGAASKDDGASVIQWACDGSDNQKWIVSVTILPINGVNFSNLMVKDTANSPFWNQDDELVVDDLIYGDRTFTFTQLSDALVGSEAIVTACNSKNSNDDLASFVATRDVTVYVLLDKRVTSLPAWLTGWKETDYSATSSNNVDFVVYEQSFLADDVVTLGTNGQSAGCLNYAVLLGETKNVTKAGNLAAAGVTANLVGGQLCVYNPGVSNIRVSVADVSGRMLHNFVAQPGTSNFEVSLSKGVYFLRVEGAGVLKALVSQ